MSSEVKPEPPGRGDKLFSREGRRRATEPDTDDGESNGSPHALEAPRSPADFRVADPEPRNFAGPLLLLAIALGVAALFVFPVKFPASIRTFGRIQCAHEWVLMRNPDGQLSASTLNHESGVSEDYRASGFDRGAAVYFNLNPSMIPGHQIVQGDTVGIMSSSGTEERLIALNGQLAQAQNLLAVNTTGEKGVVVQAARQRVEIAKRRQAEQERSFDRVQTLYHQGIVPQGQYEVAENSLHAAQDEVLMSTSALEEANAGAKPEQVQLITDRISVLRQQIAALRGQAATQTIIAPLSGLVSRSTSAEILLSVTDTSRYVAMIPVRLIDLPRLDKVPHAQVEFLGLSAPLRGHITSIDHQVTTIGAERVVMVTAILERSAAQLVVGLPLRCSILCPPVTALTILKQFLSTLVA